MSPSANDAPRFILIANPENRRAAFFQDALRRFALPPATVVPWLDVIAGRVAWDELLRKPAILRLESTGENFAVETALLAAGADVPDPEHDSARLTATEARALTEDRGRIWYPRQWYLGFRAVLQRLGAQLRAYPHIRRVHTADNVLAMFDKVQTQRRLAAAKIPIPFSLGPVASFDELLTKMKAAKVQRVFVKLAHGSSASGVVAYERSGARQQAHTSAELVRTNGELRLYNSLHVRTYRDERDIADLIDSLARERVQVEAWVPKAGIDGRRFDLRVVVTAGRAGHMVARTGRSPMTNLHLGNTRGEIMRLVAKMGYEAFRSALVTCEGAMRSFPDTLYAGVDLLIQTDWKRHAVLEVNAFGDLLPNVQIFGLNTYETQVAALTGAPIPPAGALR